MLNDVKLLGRLAQDIELKMTTNGTPVTSFDLAVPVPSKDKTIPPDYIPVVCWGELAKFADRWLGKGRQIVVSGRITTRKYTDKDGNNRKIVEVTAREIFFADSNNNSNSNQNQSNGAQNAQPAQATAENYEEVDAEDDLPF